MTVREQAVVAIRIAGVRRKRRLLDESLARLIEAGRAHRFSSERDGDSAGFHDLGLTRAKAEGDALRKTGLDNPPEQTLPRQ